MGDVPSSIGDGLAGWLSVQLEAHGRLAGAEVEPIGRGEGFVGQLGRARLTWVQAQPGAPGSVIVKLPTSDPGGRTVGTMMGLYERESRFYGELAPAVPVRVPRCYVNVADPASGSWALVLEDLEPLVPGDQVAGVGASSAALAVEQLAGLHARFYGRADLDALSWMPTLIGPATAMIVPMFEASWDDFVAHYGPRSPAPVLRSIERFAPKVPAFLESYADRPITVCHGDFRLDNMFFGDGGAFALVDWQMAMRVPGSSDLVYFLVTNLEPEVRREHQWALIDRYLAALRAGGVGEDLLPADMVERGYREGALLYGVMFVSTMTMERANERGEAFFDALISRTMSAIEDLDSARMLGL